MSIDQEFFNLYIKTTKDVVTFIAIEECDDNIDGIKIIQLRDNRVPPASTLYPLFSQNPDYDFASINNTNNTFPRAVLLTTTVTEEFLQNMVTSVNRTYLKDKPAIILGMPHKHAGGVVSDATLRHLSGRWGSYAKVLLTDALKPGADATEELNFISNLVDKIQTIADDSTSCDSLSVYQRAKVANLLIVPSNCNEEND